MYYSKFEDIQLRSFVRKVGHQQTNKNASSFHCIYF